MTELKFNKRFYAIATAIPVLIVVMTVVDSVLATIVPFSLFSVAVIFASWYVAIRWLAFVASAIAIKKVLVYRDEYTDGADDSIVPFARARPCKMVVAIGIGIVAALQAIILITEPIEPAILDLIPVVVFVMLAIPCYRNFPRIIARFGVALWWIHFVNEKMGKET
jgi:hypothetical protein